MKKLYPLVCLGVLALASCQKEEPAEPEVDVHQREIEEWQARAEAEFLKRQEAEAEVITVSAKARTLEKAVLATGVAALGLLICKRRANSGTVAGVNPVRFWFF